MDDQKRTSPWVYIGAGCLVSVFAIIAVVVAIGAWGFSRVRDMQRTLEDPVARTELAIEYLGAESLPDGYFAATAISIPFLVEMVMLSDEEPEDGGQINSLGERGFIYFKTLSMGDQEEELRDFFEGRTDNSQVLNQNSGMRFDTDELIERGSFEEDARTLRWASYRATLNSRNSANDDAAEGLTTMIMFECPGSERLRMGIWFGPDPTPELAVDEADFAGTNADPAEIQAFVAGFDVCSR